MEADASHGRGLVKAIIFDADDRISVIGGGNDGNRVGATAFSDHGGVRASVHVIGEASRVSGLESGVGIR